MRQALGTVNLGFFREHRLPLPFPKKPLYPLPTAHMAECDIQVMIKSD